MQPWEFVVVRSAEVRQRFADLARERWQNGGEDYVRSSAPAAVYADVKAGLESGGLAAAPVVVIVCADVAKIDRSLALSSVYPATQNLLLASGSLGYGTCLTTGLTMRSEEHVRELLQLPTHIVPISAIFLGRPARKLGRPRREPAADHARRERFGVGWSSVAE